MSPNCDRNEDNFETKYGFNIHAYKYIKESRDPLFETYSTSCDKLST